MTRDELEREARDLYAMTHEHPTAEEAARRVFGCPVWIWTFATTRQLLSLRDALLPLLAEMREQMLTEHGYELPDEETRATNRALFELEFLNPEPK